MRIIVHFGMPKTGSSSIQYSLFKNRSNLNLSYPALGTRNHQIILNQAFSRQKKDAQIKLAKQLAVNFEKNCDTLLSGETIFNLSFDELKEFYFFLSNYAEKIIAVGYIRSPKSFMESAFQQSLKSALINNKKREKFNFHKAFPNYKSKFEKFDEIFGKENVYFWKFSPSDFPNNCVVTHFCQQLNINVDRNSIVRFNDALSLEAISLLYAYLRYGKDLGLKNFGKKEGRFFLNLLAQYPSEKKLRFASKLVLPVFSRQNHHIDWMEKRMGVSLSEDLSKDDKYAICSESDLLIFSAETKKWLAEKLGENYIAQCNQQISSQEIADWMNILHLKINQQQRVTARQRLAAVN